MGSNYALLRRVKEDRKTLEKKELLFYKKIHCNSIFRFQDEDEGIKKSY